MRQNGFQLMMFTITSPYALVIRVRHVNDDYKRRLKKNMTLPLYRPPYRKTPKNQKKTIHPRDSANQKILLMGSGGGRKKKVLRSFS